MVEIDGRRLYTEPGRGTWWLTGMEGFFDAPTNRVDEDLIPGGDGAFDVDEPLLEPRRPVISGYCEATSAEWANHDARAWLASLAKKSDLGFRVWVGDQWMHLRSAKVRGQVKVSDVDAVSTEFEIPLWAADPHKYGETRRIHMDAIVEATGGVAFPIVDGAIGFGSTGGVLFPGVFALTNPGTAEFYPEAFTVAGPMAGFTIQSESWVIEYDGPITTGQELVITPYAGGRAVLGGGDVSHNLLRAEWVPVAPGETRGFLFTPTDPGPGAGIVVDYPEGAWW
ncbi:MULTISPECIES: hypothetical protein [unclassified Microbacterium]|uniref:hypothetical protein n=1 Tax=unclassified Microbacterium TaxID=2609290 RepID=UPI003017092E